MKNIFTILQVVFIVVCVSCKSRSVNKKKDKVKLCSVEDCIKIDTQTTNPSSVCIRYFCDKQNNEWLVYLVREFNEVNIFSLHDGSLYKKLKYESKGPQGVGRVSGIHICNMDSIYLSSAVHYQKLFISNSEGDIIGNRKFKLGKSPEGIYIVKDLSTLGNTELLTNGTDLSLICNYRQGRDNALMSKRTLFKVFTAEGEVKKVINYPSYNYLKEIGYYHFSALFSNHGELALSFHQSEDMFLYDFDKDGFEIKQVKSKYQTGGLSGRTLKGAGSIRKCMAGYVNNPSYEHLLYDKYRKVYYRFFYPGVKINTGEDVQELWETPRRFSVIVLDEKLNIIGETLMPDNKYNYKMSFVSKDGLYMSLHYKNANYSPDWLTFQKFELKENR